MKAKVKVSMRQRIIIWLIKKLLGVKTLKSPVRVLWDMIDEENRKGSARSEGGEPVPDCTKIEAWLEAVDRINKECFGGETGHEG